MCPATETTDLSTATASNTEATSIDITLDPTSTEVDSTTGLIISKKGRLRDGDYSSSIDCLWPILICLAIISIVFLLSLRGKNIIAS